MGCVSSTEVITDPVTGQVKEKKKLGGAYPGQRRPQHNPYAPADQDFDKNGQAVVHFKAYGGGNALTLVKQDGSAQPQTGSSSTGPQYIQVTLPNGVVEGQEIHVQAPNGQINAIIVPPGFGPGSTFTVEFAPEEAPPIKEQYVQAQATVDNGNSSSIAQNAASVQAQPVTSGDDGFATGFNNPNWTPGGKQY